MCHCLFKGVKFSFAAVIYQYLDVLNNKPFSRRRNIEKRYVWSIHYCRVSPRDIRGWRKTSLIDIFIVWTELRLNILWVCWKRDKTVRKDTISQNTIIWPKFCRASQLIQECNHYLQCVWASLGMGCCYWRAIYSVSSCIVIWAERPCLTSELAHCYIAFTTNVKPVWIWANFVIFSFLLTMEENSLILAVQN